MLLFYIQMPNAVFHATPIWMAALLAARCDGLEPHASGPIPWECRQDAAQFTNRSAAPVYIPAFDLNLHAGETLTVSWRPGSTSFDVVVSQ